MRHMVVHYVCTFPSRFTTRVHLNFQRGERMMKLAPTGLNHMKLAMEPVRARLQRPARPLTMTSAPIRAEGKFNLKKVFHEKQNGPQMRPARLLFGGEDRSRTDLDGFAGRCITALLPRPRYCLAMSMWPVKNHIDTGRGFPESGAGEEARTLDLNLGKVALYQLSYSRLGTTVRRHENLEREKRLELSTSTLARLRSTN